tara:strand:+ start:227 stop:1633 length:1407 start_codon:yes stop_codon:yes gene_type:complete
MKIQKQNKFILILIIISLTINIAWSFYSLNKFDKVKKNFEGEYFNQLLYSDLGPTWIIADKFKQKLDSGENFFSSIPAYERFLLPSIIVGFYYHVIDKEIFETKEENKLVIKEKNYKILLLLFQILIYYSCVLLFSSELYKKFDRQKSNLIILFLCLEPSLLQWHSSFWSESIFLSLMILVFFILLRKSRNFFLNILLGCIVGLMFMQRSVSFLYILPVCVYFLFTFKKKFKPLYFLLIGYFSVITFIGYNNFSKTGSVYFIPTHMTYYGYYHYFAHKILADRKKITYPEASEILKNKEFNWRKKNNININNTDDLLKSIKYRNKAFINEVIQNPLYSIKLFIRRSIKTGIIMPLWVNKKYYLDKTHPEAQSNPKKYYNKNLIYNLPYSLFIYVFFFVGLYIKIKKILINKKKDLQDNFYLFNLISILYFLLIAGFWGNPKYFTPCMISMSFFFVEGFSFVRKKYFKI